MQGGPTARLQSEKTGQGTGNMTETTAILEQMDRYNQLQRETRAEDRATVMAALKACGITKVVIRYDGYGDSGGVEACTVEGGHGQESLTVPVQTKLMGIGRDHQSHSTLKGGNGDARHAICGC
ncbi:hypothetical protein AA0474_3237 [Acetobacter lovaniensis NRIC 0474]|nr:hypothetical protein AA0474_3237 [Acetobacter lovaniensis NRIC 0474]